MQLRSSSAACTNSSHSIDLYKMPTYDDGIEAAAQIVDKHADLLGIAKRFPWLTSVIELGHLLKFVSKEIRSTKSSTT